MRFAIPARLVVMLAALAGGTAAHAGERQRLVLPDRVASERTLQLSPGSGVFPGYTRPRLVTPYSGGHVILRRGVPIGIVGNDGVTRPVGSYDDGRGGPPPIIVTKD
ncbi:hypothetical protein SAMN02745911_1932 [Aureimonas altamirensis DSM 21988]|uniref:Uncharacterized protein n=1 Tax=Aureimonas altamirensis DSM 21988 TaxID=1121026 RepID=A0ABY1IHK3_9HYPH|nr:hypothetical protein [Aureimonas altamirensis]SHJ18175.1 hypothetical protein SAMN02745911_1932 [Aureimonas altamirensis DSM 21988]